mmetsp:Transcript_11642/g.41555  ORF Transcript_11642/g.41555 Transcript_11642/m.41555 type:complete len:222 (-) Transcript_11642:3385-4050(-)
MRRAMPSRPPQCAAADRRARRRANPAAPRSRCAGRPRRRRRSARGRRAVSGYGGGRGWLHRQKPRGCCRGRPRAAAARAASAAPRPAAPATRAAPAHAPGPRAKRPGRRPRRRSGAGRGAGARAPRRGPRSGRAPAGPSRAYVAKRRPRRGDSGAAEPTSDATVPGTSTSSPSHGGCASPGQRGASPASARPTESRRQRRQPTMSRLAAVRSPRWLRSRSS